MDYISREAAIEAMYELCNKDQRQIFTREQLLALDDVPAADVREVKRGHWIDRYSGGNLVPFDDENDGCPVGSCYCSVCGDWLTASDEYPAKGNFCPNCGASMLDEEEQT